MGFVPGDVVCLKSGGQPLTVAAVDGDNVKCVWLGEEGDLFRETIPSVVLIKIDTVDEDDEDEEGDEEEDEDESPARRQIT